MLFSFLLEWYFSSVQTLESLITFFELLLKPKRQHTTRIETGEKNILLMYHGQKVVHVYWSRFFLHSQCTRALLFGAPLIRVILSILCLFGNRNYLFCEYYSWWVGRRNKKVANCPHPIPSEYQWMGCMINDLKSLHSGPSNKKGGPVLSMDQPKGDSPPPVSAVTTTSTSLKGAFRQDTTY